MRNPSSSKEDLASIAELTPFSQKDLKGQALRRGSMLGGANPVIKSDTPQSWKV